MMQFEIANTLNIMELASFMGKVQTSGSKMDVQGLMSNLMGTNYEWKIGDVDELWDRNLGIVKT